MPSAHQIHLALIMADLPALAPHRHAAPCDCTPTVALIRVSSIKGRKAVESPRIQYREIEKHALENNLRILRIAYEIDKSGGGEEEDRPELQKIIAEIRAGMYFHITMWKWSRWGRNNRVSQNMVYSVYEAGGSIASATEPFDTNTVKGLNDRDKAILDAQVQARLIGEGWRNAHVSRRDDQLPHSGRRRFGYDYIDKQYVLNENESALLKKAYLDYLSGQSMGQIARLMQESGMKTTLDGDWTKQGVARMLDTGFAAGLIRERSITSHNGKKLKPGNSIKDYDVWRPGKQKKIIEMAVWEQYKERRVRQAGLPPRARKPAHELSSMLLCGLCSRRMITKYSGRDQSHQWTCSWRQELHPGQAVSISNSFALKIVREWLAERTQPEWVEAAARRAFDETKTAGPENHQLITELDRVRKSLSATDALIIKATSVENHGRAARLVRNLDDLEKQEQVLLQQIASIPKAKTPPDFRSFIPILDRWDEIPKETHREALGTVLAMIVVGPTTVSTSRLEAARARLTFVEVDDLPDWSDWLVSRRHKAA